MLRFLLIVVVFLGIALRLLADNAPELVFDVVLFAFLLVFIGLIVKVALDFRLYSKKTELDRQSEKRILNQSDGKTFLDIDDYNKASESRHQRRIKQSNKPK